MKQVVLYIKKGTAHQHLIPTVKYYSICWRGNDGLWLFVASGPGQLAIIDGTSLSEYFAEECKAICPPIDAQQKLGDATRLLPKVLE